MKFIFSFLFAFIFILPVSADNQCTGLTQTTNPTCTGTAGCVWEEGECSQCQSGTYSAAGENECLSCDGDPNYQTILSDQTKQHPRGASSCSDWVCIDNYFPVDTNNDNVLDGCSLCDPNNKPEHAEFYNDDCDWSCIQGYYEDNNSCIQCPTGSYTTAPGATSISQCQCDSGYYRGGANDDECKTCPDNSDNCTTNGGNYGLTTETVTCEYGYVKSVSNGVVTCEQCSCTQPEHGSCTATYNETTGGCQTTITCNVGYYKTETSGTVSCTACPSHSTTDNTGSTSISECKCYSGYYRGGTNMDVCIQCTGELSCSGTGLTYSNTSNPNGFSCSDGWQLVPNNATKTYSCQSCSDSNATLENGNCKCKQNYYGTIAGLDTQCTACPQHSTTDGTGSTSISACKCNIGYYKTETSGTVSCTACPSHSTTDGTGSTSISACKCNIGFYDTESDTDSVSCGKCPIGMTTVTLDSNGNPTNTTTNGATSIEHCAMLATSDFCFTNPDSTNRQLICTKLILPGAIKINGRTISTTTNSGN